MKLSKAEIAAIIITVIFIAVTVVFSLPGRDKDVSVTVSAQQTGETQKASTQPDPPPESSEPLLVNINSATVEELCALPEIGEKTAERIIAYREKNGPFKSTDEIMSVSGIGSKTYEEIRSYITTD
ncbi:MAG: helix-hairpin-helix domain-containing protein [Oscillospiraceae bacterium]